VIGGLALGALVGSPIAFVIMFYYGEAQNPKPNIGLLFLGMLIVGALGLWLSIRVKGVAGSLLLGFLIGALGILGFCSSLVVK
jgi:hypothetical protein